MDAFLGITLSIIVLYMWWRSETKKPGPRDLQRNTLKARWDGKTIKAERPKQETKLAQKATKEKRERDDVELISVIIPTINNDK